MAVHTSWVLHHTSWCVGLAGSIRYCIYVSLIYIYTWLYLIANACILFSKWNVSDISYVLASCVRNYVYIIFDQVLQMHAKKHPLYSWGKSCLSVCQTSWRKSTCCPKNYLQLLPCRWFKAGKLTLFVKVAGVETTEFCSKQIWHA